MYKWQLRQVEKGKWHTEREFKTRSEAITYYNVIKDCMVCVEHRLIYKNKLTEQSYIIINMKRKLVESTNA